MIRLQRVWTSIFLADSLSIFPSWLILSTKQAAKLEKPVKQGTGDGLWATACKELGDANNHMNLKMYLFSVKLWDDYDLVAPCLQLARDAKAEDPCKLCSDP